MGLNIGIARTDDHHIRLQLIGKFGYFIANVAAAYVNLNIVFRQREFFTELIQLFFSVLTR